MSASISGTLKTAVNPSWINNSTFYEMNIRQYSTTKNFTGAAARLKDLKTLGVEALIVNPIFPIGKSKMVGTLGSIFATTDLSKVNPSLGTLTNFESFMTSAKSAGLKVILKVPLDTAAIDHGWATTQSNWFKRNSSYDLVPVPSKAYLAYYDYGQEELQQSIIEDLKSWVLDADIDGYIFTGATDVPLDFLNELTYRLQTTKSLVIGTTDEVDSSYFKNNLTLTSNGELLKSLTSISKGTSTKAQLTTLLNSQVSDFQAPVLALNHLSSYETMEGGRTETSRLGAGLKIASMLTFTLPGAPVIFQGQEIANITALKPFDSSNIAWPTKTPTAFAEYEKLVSLKTANSALFNEKYGGTSTVLTTTSNSLFAFSRKLSSNTVLVVVNLSNKALKAKFDSGVTATMYKYSDNKSVKMISKGYELTLPALSFEIFTNAIVK
jgi:glycosidase